MTHCATILIADRNPYVRQFLQREMHRAGYAVLLADSGRQVLFWVERGLALDLIILDPDLPDADICHLLKQLNHRFPQLPIVIHGHAEDEAKCIHNKGIRFVEKGGNSVERIVQVVENALAATVRCTHTTGRHWS
ncbi:MAG: response regulator [Desulfatitalea sp.]|nr:response regulator [Desulfatitalea sp.]